MLRNEETKEAAMDGEEERYRRNYRGAGDDGAAANRGFELFPCGPI
jgi:hypothetical protein